VPSIAWSGSGSHLIAATDSGPAEFVVIEVTDGGRTLVPTRKFEACPVRPNSMGRYSHLPNDIVTANGLLTPVVPTSTASPTDAFTETPTSTLTNTPSTTPSSTTPPSTMVPPQAVFLPILLRIACSVGSTQTDVVLMIDMSTSMRRLTATGRPKYVAAIEAAAQFVDRLHSPDAGAGRNRVAVIGFNSDAWLQEGLTADRAALQHALDRLEGRIQEGSRLDLALSEARVTLNDAPAQSRKVAILLTDGLPNGVPPAEDGRQETTILRIADAMKAGGMTVFGVGLGERADLDESLLRAVASGDDHYWHAKDGEDLAPIYAAMAEVIDCPR
jgi:Mg-chelatase subunit ChlD